MSKWEYGKLFVDAEGFLEYLQSTLIAQLLEAHVHHTWRPEHKDFTGDNHKRLQDGMRQAHLNRGFQDIAQHITIFPDGSIMTGRDVNIAPASATGYNDSDLDMKHPFMFEIVGNFDIGHDKLEGEQLESAVKVTRYLFDKGAAIKFHNEMSSKTCPGSSVDKAWFVGLVKEPPKSAPKPFIPPFKRYLKLSSPMMHGSDIKEVQRKLGRLVVDGWYGRRTQARVREFQASKKILVDGIYGPVTHKKLFG